LDSVERFAVVLAISIIVILWFHSKDGGCIAKCLYDLNWLRNTARVYWQYCISLTPWHLRGYYLC